MWKRHLSIQNHSSFFLFGPRGTGKTTWIRQQFPEAAYFDLLDDSVYASLVAHPDRLEPLAKAKTKSSWIVIDEVQKVPGVLDEVHRLIEKKKWKFVLTGSSARKLRRSGANLLAGRALTFTMHPLTVLELGPDFKLGHGLRFGFLPSVWTVPEPEKYLKSYVGTYLREEVEEESLVRNIGQFAKFLEAASFSQASVLSVQNVADDCGVNRKTAQNHFELLEDLLLGIRLPVFQRKAKRKMATHPKFFYFDLGVYRVLRPRGPLDTSEEIDGAAIETMVLQELRALNSNRDLGYGLFYWRTQEQHEVDFVLYGERGFFGIEIKRSNRFRESDLKSLKLFLSDYPQAKGLLFYGGEECLEFDRIKVLPLATALKDLPKLLGSEE